MSAQPQTIITIYKAVTDMTYSNVYDYTSEAAFLSALNLNTHVTFHEQQYVRKNFAIELEIPFDEAEDYTYCVYDNGEGRGNEFAFIKEKIFCNFSVTRFVLVYDVWANYQKLSKYSNSELRGFVERCHQDYKQINLLNDISLVANNSKRIIGGVPTTNYIALIVFDSDNGTFNTSSDISASGNERIGSVIKIFNQYKMSTQDMPAVSLNDFCKDFTSSPYVYAVYVTPVPASLTSNFGTWFNQTVLTLTGGLSTGCYAAKASSVMHLVSSTFRITMNYVNDDDLKCNTYPYCFYRLYLPNDYIDLAFDNFSNVDFPAALEVTIQCIASFSSSGIYLRFEPQYASLNDNEQNQKIININSPLAKNVDNYEMFMAENSNYITQQIWGAVSSGFKTGTNALIHGGEVGSSVALGAASTAMNLIDSVANMEFNIANMKAAPDKPSFSYGLSYCENFLGNSFAKLVRFYLDENTLNMLHNKFVSMGYPLNKYVDINYRTRTNYDFIKAYDITTSHRVCNEERAILNQIFSRGVRIWHNPLPMEFGVPSTNANNPMRS